MYISKSEKYKIKTKSFLTYMNKMQPQAAQIKPLSANTSLLKEVYNTNQVENIATNLDFENGYDIFKNSKNITNNSNNKLNNNGEKKVVKCSKCFNQCPSKIGLTLSRPSRPTLPPNMKFAPPNSKFGPSNCCNNKNAIQEGKGQNSSPEMQSGQILFVYNS